MSVRACTIGYLVAAAGCATALGQDSVALTPGGNDALSAYDVSTLVTRYVVDAAPFESSWGGLWQIAPVVKASRDLDPLFRTQILGASAVSPQLATAVVDGADFLVWQAAGAGVHPSANSAPGAVETRAGFPERFAIAVSDFSLAPTNIVTATVGLDPANPARLYVTRHAAASSRGAGGAADTATLSLGSVTPSGVTFFRADNYGTLADTADRVTGDNVLSFTPAAPGAPGAVNTLFNSGGTNTAENAAATAYIVRNETAPHNTPSNLVSPGGTAHALIFDLRALFRAGSSTSNISANTTAHRATGVAGHRGNPSYSPVTVLGGNGGTIAAIAKPTTGGLGAKVNMLAAFGVNAAGTTPPSVASGTARAFTLPSPISDGTFTANTGGDAEFRQYLSQESFRGANGQVGIGTNAAGDLLLGAVATDASQGDFVAIVRYTAPSTSAWSIVARPGSAVLDGPSPAGAQIGAISATDAAFSAPAIDLLGNVYFTATWQPALGPAGVGVFKAVDVGGTYKLEKIVATGDTFAGANSTRNYTITSIALEDSDSLASGAFHSSSLLQQQRPSATTTDAALSNAAGGLIVSAVITYDNAGTPESYDAVLFVSARVADEPEPCPGDFDGSGAVNATDIFVFLDAWFSQNGQTGSGLSADADGSGTVDASDIFVYLDVWFTNNGVPCP